MRKLFDWLDHRTGYRYLLSEALYENIPGGSRWRYVWGSTLVFAFFVQVVTGLFLWMGYSPSAQTAWESVYFLDQHTQGGWLLRSMHHYAAQIFVVLLAIHLLQVIIDGAYKAPREINFWVGLILMLIVLGLALTGYLLPWDQKGYWATRVATEIAGAAGGDLPLLAVGGSDYGHLTLTRFFALHAGILPALMVVFLVIHIAVFRRHSITAHISPTRPRPDQHFWPEQFLKDGIACLAVLLVIVGLSWFFRAELGAPANPAENYSAARPEWYFLFLFQLLKYFPGEYGKLLGAIVIPGAVLAFMFLMPLIGRRRAGHWLNVGFVFAVLMSAVALTGLALNEDYYALRVDESELSEVHSALDAIAVDLRKQGEQSPYFGKSPQQQLALNADGDARRVAELEAQWGQYRKYQNSLDFLQAVARAEFEARRVQELAPQGIPPTGALTLLRQDPKTQGPKLFRRHCVGCHDYLDPDGHGLTTVRPIQHDPKTGKFLPNGAPNLYGFASRRWLAGLLNPDEIARVHRDEATYTVTDAPYFGNTKHASASDAMVEFVTTDLTDLDEAGREKLEAIIVAVSAEAKLKWQAEADEVARNSGLIEKGTEEFAEPFENYACADCHRLGDIDQGGEAVDLTGYGSRQWTIEFIRDPTHARFYGKKGNDRMPSFDPADQPNQQQLSLEKITLIVDWMREDWYEPSAEESLPTH